MDYHCEFQNKQDLYNKGLIQQQFNNQTDIAKAKAAARAGQAQNAASAANSAAQNAASTWGGIGSGISQLGSSISSYAQDQENKKKRSADV